MADETLQRRLAAILSADAVGYSRLMHQDEVSAVEMIKYCRQLISDRVDTYDGRVIDSPGDNLLAEFGSVIQAVSCAIDIQARLQTFNQAYPEDQRMSFRIGINSGDVIVDGRRIYGDGVNIAARLEKLADPGGICLSGSAYKQVQNKLPLGCEYLGEKSVKNIKRPITVYKVWQDTEAKVCTVSEPTRTNRRYHWQIVVPVAAIVLFTAAVLLWTHFSSQPNAFSRAEKQEPSGNVIEKATIAVLPFANLSEDKEQEYFSDGITRDIITDLSRFPEMVVTASSNAFKYKDQNRDLKQVGAELGVRYILEGSVQKAGSQIRINAELVDADAGQHIWAERYEGALGDIFQFQNDITAAIVKQLAIKVYEAERTRSLGKETTSLEAYDYYLRGNHFKYQYSRKTNMQARQYYKKSLSLDPEYAPAYVGLADSRIMDANYGWTEFPDKAFEQAHDLAKKAIEINPSYAQARATIGYIYMRQGKYDLAIDELEQAVELNPNDWRSYSRLGAVMLYSGRLDDALDIYEDATRYDPYPRPGSYMNIGIIHYLKGQVDEARLRLRKCTEKWPTFLGCHIVLTSVYAHAGQLDDARNEAVVVRRLSPFFETQYYGVSYRNKEHRNKIVDGLHMAGLD